MKTICLPPVYPFGNSPDDGVTFDLIEAAIHLFPLNPKCDLFIRINTYAEDQSASFLIGSRAEIQDDIVERLGTMKAKLAEGKVAMLIQWKLKRLAKTVGQQV